MDHDAFLRRLKARMQDMGYTPKLLSRKIGAGPTYIRDLFEGRSKNPTAGKLIRLASALAIPVSELIGGSNFAQFSEPNPSLSPTDLPERELEEDDDAFADVSIAVEAMLREEHAPHDLRSVSKMSRIVWRDIHSLPAVLPFQERLELTLSERRSQVRTARAAMFSGHRRNASG